MKTAAEVGQREAIEFLERSSTHGPEARPPRRIDTHGSIVFLAGDRAYKMKRAVAFEYMDFSTLERRRRFCDAEIRLNQRGAPGMYLRTVAVTREPGGHLAVGGAGKPIEWLVEMVRFDEDTLFDRMAASGAIEAELTEAMAEMIAAYLEGADVHLEPGASATMAEIVEENARLLEAGAGTVFEAQAIAALAEHSRTEALRLREFSEGRRQTGKVRRCHGDLHLRNLCLFAGRPALFDTIEFNDRLAIVDVLYDLAFLLMDLWHRGLKAEANRVLNRYLESEQDYDGVAGLPLFLSCRAAIRAHVSVPAAEAQSGSQAAEAIRSEGRAYLNLARAFLTPAPAQLVAVGGLSGTGKSVQSRALAPEVGAVPGAVILRSDVRRKAMMGVSPTAPLGPEGYREEVTRAVYEGLRRDADRVLAGGHSVILDAVYARPDERAAVTDLAKNRGVSFQGIWLEAPVATKVARVAAREGDASDAGASVVRAQAEYDTGAIDWIRVSADRPPGKVTENLRGILFP